MGKPLATLPVPGVPACGGEALFGEELPSRGFRELEAILHRIFQEAVETPGRRRRLAPDEVFAEQKSLIAKPEDQFVLKRAALIAVPLGPVVQHEASMRLQGP